MITGMDAELEKRQQGLLGALFAQPGDGTTAAMHAAITAVLDTASLQASRGWMAYRANGHAMAERTLSAAYPVVAALVGAESFAMLARDLWHRHPPTQGDLARWGSDLPAWLAHCESLADVPYLADVAHVEWALHRASTCTDTHVNTASFALLTSEDPASLSLVLAPGTVLIDSDFPVVALITAHLSGEPGLAEVGAMLRKGVRQTARVWRQGLRPRLAPSPCVEQVLLRALGQGMDLVSALELACSAEAAMDFDFSRWLTGAVTDGLVVGVRGAAPLSSISPEPSP